MECVIEVECGKNYLAHNLTNAWPTVPNSRRTIVEVVWEWMLGHFDDRCNMLTEARWNGLIIYFDDIPGWLLQFWHLVFPFLMVFVHLNKIQCRLCCSRQLQCKWNGESTFTSSDKWQGFFLPICIHFSRKFFKCYRCMSWNRFSSFCAGQTQSMGFISHYLTQNNVLLLPEQSFFYLNCLCLAIIMFIAFVWLRVSDIHHPAQPLITNQMFSSTFLREAPVCFWGIQ